MHDLNSLAGRLAYCTELAGGKRAMSLKTGISEAQLFRYINGDHDISVNRLQAVAQAVSLDVTWLLSGKENGQKRPDFKPELLQDIVQQVEEILLDNPVRFTPKQKSKAYSLIYDAISQEAEQSSENALDKGMLLHIIEYLSPLRAADEIGTYHNLLSKFNDMQQLSEPEALMFERLVGIGNAASYEGLSGQIYYDRVGYSLGPEASAILLNMVALVSRKDPSRKLNWLDIGCGNSRHLAFLKQHAPHLQLHGIDQSALATKLNENLVKAGKLSSGTFQQADVSSLPYEDNSMDVIFWRQGLYSIPYFPQHPFGLNQVAKEISRVLNKGGHVQIMSVYGQKTFGLTFLQEHDERSIRKVFEPCGLELFKFQVLGHAGDNKNWQKGRDYNQRYGNMFTAILKKA